MALRTLPVPTSLSKRSLRARRVRKAVIRPRWDHGRFPMSGPATVQLRKGKIPGSRVIVPSADSHAARCDGCASQRGEHVSRPVRHGNNLVTVSKRIGEYPGGSPEAAYLENPRYQIVALKDVENY